MAGGAGAHAGYLHREHTRIAESITQLRRSQHMIETVLAAAPR